MSDIIWVLKHQGTHTGILKKFCIKSLTIMLQKRLTVEVIFDKLRNIEFFCI